MKSLALVEEFHRTYGQPIADTPNVSDTQLSQLRLDLLAEELCELAEALGFKLSFQFEAEGLETDPVGVLDALTDLQYVLDGAYLSLGLHHIKNAALNEVHRSNMSKLGADGKPIRREDGKVLKGPNYSPPDLQKIMRWFQGDGQ